MVAQEYKLFLLICRYLIHQRLILHGQLLYVQIQLFLSQQTMPQVEGPLSSIFGILVMVHLLTQITPQKNIQPPELIRFAMQF